MSRAGWSGGKFSAPKLFQSVSTSGPSATVNPMPDEHVLQVLDGLGDEVQVAGAGTGDHLGEVDPLGLEPGAAGDGLQLGAALADGGLRARRGLG